MNLLKSTTLFCALFVGSFLIAHKKTIVTQSTTPYSVKSHSLPSSEEVIMNSSLSKNSHVVGRMIASNQTPTSTAGNNQAWPLKKERAKHSNISGHSQARIHERYVESSSSSETLSDEQFLFSFEYSDEHSEVEINSMEQEYKSYEKNEKLLGFEKVLASTFAKLSGAEAQSLALSLFAAHESTTVKRAIAIGFIESSPARAQEFIKEIGIKEANSVTPAYLAVVEDQNGLYLLDGVYTSASNGENYE